MERGWNCTSRNAAIQRLHGKRFGLVGNIRFSANVFIEQLTKNVFGNVEDENGGERCEFRHWLLFQFTVKWQRSDHFHPCILYYAANKTGLNLFVWTASYYAMGTYAGIYELFAQFCVFNELFSAEFAISCIFNIFDFGFHTKPNNHTAATARKERRVKEKKSTNLFFGIFCTLCIEKALILKLFNIFKL